MVKMLKYKDILFDDYSKDEYGTYSTICKKCQEKYKNNLSNNEIDNGTGGGVCGVKGCTESDWETEIDVEYIDFKDGEFEIVEI